MITTGTVHMAAIGEDIIHITIIIIIIQCMPVLVAIGAIFTEYMAQRLISREYMPEDIEAA